MNGCSVSDPSVFPKNWNETGADISIDWRIQYYYHDPEHAERWPKGKLCIVKGMNEYKTLTDRRLATKAILQDELDHLRGGWNPIRQVQMMDESIDYTALHPNLPFIDAFNLSIEKLSATDRHKHQVRVVIARLEKAANKLRMRNIAIGDLKRKELKSVLSECNFPDNYFNHAKGYISSLFAELLEEECCDTNLARDIRRKKIVTKQREILNQDQMQVVMAYLKRNHYSFWRYAEIFMFSGARSSELINLQRKDVDLTNQEFTVLIKKGKNHKRVKKVILKQVIGLWEEVCSGAKDDDFLFSKGLEPGEKKIKSYQVTLRWKRRVKESEDIFMPDGSPLKVTADFYALKHAMLDSLPTEIAMKLASHTNMRTTSIYQVNQEKRDREELKKLRVV